jgi:hypothetical protein
MAMSFPHLSTFPILSNGKKQVNNSACVPLDIAQALSFIPPDGEFPLASVSWSSRHWIGGVLPGPEMLGNLEISTQNIYLFYTLRVAPM